MLADDLVENAELQQGIGELTGIIHAYKSLLAFQT
jgi:hypothetical protein